MFSWLATHEQLAICFDFGSNHLYISARAPDTLIGVGVHGFPQPFHSNSGVIRPFRDLRNLRLLEFKKIKNK